MFSVFVVIVVIFLPSSLFGYLDPGTGTALVSLIIAGISSLIFFMKGIIIRLLKGDKAVSKDRDRGHKIAILSEGKQYFGTFAPILRSLIKQKQHFDYYSLDEADPALEIEDQYMHSKFLGFGNVSYYKASNIKADILLTTTPNIGNKNYPVKRPDQVKELVHVFHSVDDISMYKQGSLDYYDKVILSGDFQKASIREIERVRNLPEKKLVVLGLPYFDELIRECKPEESTGSNTTILIGSSWGEKGCLKSYGADFIIAIAQAGYEVIIRPHPQSFISEPEFIESMQKLLEGYRNIHWDRAVSPSEAMNKADILISDTSSIRFDFAFIYEKPVITLAISSSEMPGYERDYVSNDWRSEAAEIIGTVLDKKEIENIALIIKQVLQNYKSDKIEKFREQTIRNFGKSGEAIATYLINLAKESDNIAL
jgi:hypothetical protein